MLAMNAQNIRKIKPNQKMLCVSYTDAIALGKHGHLQESFCPIHPGSLGVSIFLCIFQFLFALYLFAGVCDRHFPNLCVPLTRTSCLVGGR